MPGLRQALNGRLRSPNPYPDGRFEGRGIVICAGGPRYFTCAWVLITVLRRAFRIDLPIQVWHLGLREMSEEMRLLLGEMDVEVVDAETVVGRYPARLTGGWPLKPYAILHSRFREVLYLDADTIPLKDLNSLFDWDIYRAQGLVMWPDILDLKAENPIWKEVGLEPRNCISVEAGVLLADKRRTWDMLEVAVLLNEHVEEIYQVIYGDKDTFLLASLLCNRSPFLIPHRPFIFDVDLVHCDPDGEPVLLHRTGSKWTLLGPNGRLPNAELMPMCQQALSDLGARWSGAVFNAPPRTQNAQAEWERLIAVRYFHYIPQGSDGRRLELLPAGRVGEGRGDLEQHWGLIERDGALVLQFYSASRLTIELTAGKDGTWQGNGIAPVSFRGRLVEESACRTWPYAGGRVAKSAGEWLDMLLDPTTFAAGFDAQKASDLRAALTLLNDCFDDVAEQIKARLSTIIVPAWRQMLSDVCPELAASRDKRIVLTGREDYPHVIDPNCYDRIP
jgi:Mannosyltransferase putative